MNILLINHYASVDEMEHRPFYLGREWVRRGHSVTIVAASFSHLRRRNLVLDMPVWRQRLDGVDWVWIRTPKYTGNGARRVLNMLSFVARLLRLGRQLVDEYRPDAVIASSTYPFDILPAWRMARRASARLIFEVHDLWPLTLIELGGISKLHPVCMCMKLAESFAYRRSDGVVSILPTAESYMLARGMPAGKFVHIPNGIAPTEWNGTCLELSPLHAQVLAGLKRAGRSVVGYAGAHGLANALWTVIEAAEILKRDAVSFVLVGQGPLKSNLMRAATERGLDNIVFLPAVPKAAVPALMRQMDALYIGLKDQPLFRFGVSPNKMIDYMMAGKPVVQAIKAGNDLVKESGCGISVPPEDARAVAGAVKRLSEMEEPDRLAMGAKGRAYVLERHDYRVLADRFLKVLQ